MSLDLTSSRMLDVAATIGAGAILCITMSGCEDSRPTPSTASLNAGAAPRVAAAPTTAAEAIFVRSRGPSDRPAPILVFAGDEAASRQALADLANSEPMGGTPVLVEPTEFRAMLATIAPTTLQPGAVAVLELEVCGPSPRRAMLDGAAAARWIDAAEACLAAAAPGRGYLRSMRVTLPK